MGSCLIVWEEAVIVGSSGNARFHLRTSHQRDEVVETIATVGSRLVAASLRVHHNLSCSMARYLSVTRSRRK